MTSDTEPPDSTEPAADSTPDSSGHSDGIVNGQLVSDLFVNVVPIAIIAAFVLMFGLLSPGGDDPLLFFHGALIVGVVLVSAVAAWIIHGEDSPLEGSAAGETAADSERE